MQDGYNKDNFIQMNSKQNLLGFCFLCYEAQDTPDLKQEVIRKQAESAGAGRRCMNGCVW